MKFSCSIILILALILVNSSFSPACAQLGFDLKVDKPEPYQDRVLKAEKTSDKPLKAPKRFFQNLTTHYNYFFNANNKLNEVIDEAKAAFTDDYTLLLPFYNYSLDVTAQNTHQLDSVIYKSQTGIVMHDLRNDWVDNMYLLWGAAYFFEKKFDSAALMFQFINYAFAEKEADGYYRYIGSRMDGNNALSISTEEDRKFPKNLVTPPSRNNALIWQIRTQMEIGNMAEAGSLIATLKNDPLFPERLHSDLEEVQAFWYYKQKMWDSSAVHLLNALDQAKTRQEEARWEYLAAQMMERAGKPEEAQRLYSRAIKHTTDPVMDIYARLNTVRIKKDTTDNYINQNIAELLKMARKDKYVDYRDIIYFMAAQMELERNNLEAAQQLLLKGAKYNNNNLASLNRSYLLIADLSFDQGKYHQAAAFYDSLKTRELDEDATARINERKPVLDKLIGYLTTIEREDSLQRIAAMPEEERLDFITTLVKQLRKQQGLDDNITTSGSAFPNSPPADLFSSQSSKGEWYFYNKNLKTKGHASFQQIWGNRPNVDNWRRFAQVNQQMVSQVNSNLRTPDEVTVRTRTDEDDFTVESLLGKLPLTEVQLQASNDTIQNAMFNLGKTYLDELNDHASAIETFEEFRIRFPGSENMEEALFYLYRAFLKNGDQIKADEIKNLLMQKDPASRFATIITTGKDPASPNKNLEEITRVYEDIYDIFIEGRFTDALAAKQKADSMYQTTFWQPQLLYIEAVYHIRQRNDSGAINVLNTLMAQSPDSPMASKAQSLIDVLNRRYEIEAELRNLKITMPVEEIVQQTDTFQVRDSVVMQDIVEVPPVKGDSTIIQGNDDKVVIDPSPVLPADTVSVKNPIVQPKTASVYAFNSALKHYVMIVLDKVDPLFVNEVRNAFSRYNREKYYNKPFEIGIRDFDADRKLLLIGDFENAQEAVEYLQATRRIAPNEIVPWLDAKKYSFYITTDPNLEILIDKKDFGPYNAFLSQYFPGIF